MVLHPAHPAFHPSLLVLLSAQALLLLPVLLLHVEQHVEHLHMNTLSDDTQLTLVKICNTVRGHLCT